MTIRFFLLTSFLAAIIGAGVTALILTSLDPMQAGVSGFTLLFLSLFITLAGFTATIGYLVRRVIMPQTFEAYLVRASLRQGIVISVFFSVLLFLQLLRLYRWWIAIILVVLLLSLELVFSSYDHPHTNRHRRD
jgi:hypothetical protein